MLLKALRNILLISLAFVQTNAFGQSTGTMLTDLWWNPAESGWGMTVTESESFLFVTFYVHRGDGSPYWVTAQLLRTTPGSGVAAPISFSGDVYETRGTYYGQPWNPAIKSDRKVGTAVFTVDTGLTTGTVSYTVDGVPVTRRVQRQTLQYVNFSGAYVGGTILQTFNCSPSSLNGESTDGGTITISHNGSSILLVARSTIDNSSCTFSGLYAQSGQWGSAAGSYSCTSGTFGSFSLAAMQWTVGGMTALVSGRNQFCQFLGVIGGITGNHGLQ